MADSFARESGDFSAEQTPRVPGKLASITAFARFEFEAGRGNDGTKILMVEWEDDDLARSPVGSWHVSWDGKKTVLPADEQVNENDHTRRCYFLLPPGTTIPPVITLTYEPPPNSASTVKNQDSIHINPLPAIYPPELGVTARSAGKKGVLHTIWAKKRLQSLEKEIKAESEYNPEGVALEMAVQEKEWIESNFGVGGGQQQRPAALSLQDASGQGAPLSPSYTPVSPTGGKRLTEKLKGLKLETSEGGLARRNTGEFRRDRILFCADDRIASSRPDPNLHPLSPDEPDVAISSFSSFHTATSAPQNSVPRTFVSQPPPEHIRQAQQQQPSGFASLSSNSAPTTSDTEGLFAKALSPRSPDIPKSPFSFSAEETIPQAMQRIKGQ